MATSVPLVPVPNAPGIYMKGSRYIVVYRHRGKQRKKSLRTLTEARDFKAKAHRGEAPQISSRTLLVKYAATWLDSYSGRTCNGLRDSSRDAYRDIIDRLVIPFYRSQMPTLRLSEVSPSDLRAFIAHLAAEGYAPASVRRYFTPLRALIATAFDEGHIARNPAHGLRVIVPANASSTPKTKHGGKPKPKLTAEQTKALLAQIPEEHADLVFLLASTGLRISEALSLRWADFKTVDEGDDDGAAPVLTIRTSKTLAGLRSLALSPETARRLTKRRSTLAHNGHDDPIFASTAGTKIEAHNFRQRVFKPAAKRAGIPWATPHQLRHGLASMMASEGFNAAQIASQLGHADNGITALRWYVKAPLVNAPGFIDEALSQ